MDHNRDGHSQQIHQSGHNRLGHEKWSTSCSSPEVIQNNKYGTLRKEMILEERPDLHWNPPSKGSCIVREHLVPACYNCRGDWRCCKCMPMTLGELDQAFGERITAVIEPLPPIQFIHKKEQHTASFSDVRMTFSRRFTFSRQPIAKPRHEEVPI